MTRIVSEQHMSKIVFAFLTRQPIPTHQPGPRSQPGSSGSAGPSRGIGAEAGFTLLEILVVIAILGLLIGLVAPAVLRQLGSARTSVVKQSIERIGSVLDLYKLDVGSYPNSEQGLKALIVKPSGVTAWNGPYLKAAEVPADPWSHPYSYHAPSSRPAHDYDLCSSGPSGPSTQDLICNP